jgi:hypothetical protein
MLGVVATASEAFDKYSNLQNLIPIRLNTNIRGETDQTLGTLNLHISRGHDEVIIDPFHF